MKKLAWFIVSGAVLLMALTADGQCPKICGDCDNDNKVSIAELITAVRNAIRNDECGYNCFDNAACPNECIEFPQLEINHELWTCSTSMCFNNETQLRRCMYELSQTSEVCWVIK